MEIEDQDGAKIELSNDRKAVFGRESGFCSDDRTVSRRHLTFEVKNGANQTGSRVSFEVIGKNPVWVRRYEDDEVRVFRGSERGELSEGDWFCLSGSEPTWFALRKIRAEDWESRVLSEEDESELAVSPRVDSELDDSEIDPVKEFGFVVMGHEFDTYPKNMIREAKKWDWFLEEDRKENSDDEEDEFDRRKKRGPTNKRKKGQDNEDDDWAGEGEDDKEIVGAVRKGVRAKYTTRSKDCNKQPRKDGQGSKNSTPKKICNSNGNNEDEDDDDDEDETLGGFVVVDDDMDREEEEVNEDDDEEDELAEDDDDDDEEDE